MAVIEYASVAPRPTVERPIRIYLNDVPVAVSQGSPYDLAELAVGYLLSEGLITDRDRFAEVTVDADAPAVYVASGESAEDGYVPLHRVTSAGCARSALLTTSEDIPTSRCVESPVTFNADALLACMDELCERSPRRNTGECVHGCGLGESGASSLLLVREDIGRHNAMDKLIGQAWLDRVTLSDKALFITGRISAEMALKAHRAGCPVLVSRKSATDEAARRAQELGVTLVSHCRDGGMRVLSCPERVQN